jgi:glycine/D-amino acid oxidase-like deaminating enzyme/nitrite reductase/ring-hydroxylating ferredoxin subunit
MKRDGATPSPWQEGIEDFVPRQTPFPTKTFDVIIAGGGITGVTTALLLQQQGLSCVIAEAQTLCFGTTGGTTAHLNTFLDTSYDQVVSDFGESGAQLLHTAAREALDLVKSNIAHLAIDCQFEEKDGYVYAQGPKQSDKLDKIYQGSVTAEAEVAYTKSVPVPIPFDKAIVYRNQAQFHPTRYVMALAKAFEEAGGTIIQHCRVESHEGTDTLSVQTTLGTLKGRYLVFATHIPQGVNLLHFRCAPYRSYAMAVTLADDAYPDGLAYDLYDPYHYYRTQEVNGRKYLIAGGEDHKTAHVTNTEQCFTHLDSHLRQHFNVAHIDYKWSSQYFEPADGLAYIGQLPGNGENVFVATGFGGNGMTYSHIAAITLTGLIAKGVSPYEDLFRPGRVKPMAGFAAFVKENVDVVKEFVGKRIKKEKLSELAELAPGEGRVVSYEGESVGIYKDESGKIYAVNPVCTHVKCLVDWNNSEKTWDCPCHGARYSITGEVLTGPARHDLDVIHLDELGTD